jgi:hypothetical protein
VVDRLPMARANSAPASRLRSRRWKLAPHTKKAIAQMKSPVDAPATIVIGAAKKASATRSPLGRPRARTSRATPTTAAAAAAAAARLTAMCPRGSSTATIVS